MYTWYALAEDEKAGPALECRVTKPGRARACVYVVLMSKEKKSSPRESKSTVPKIVVNGELIAEQAFSQRKSTHKI